MDKNINRPLGCCDIAFSPTTDELEIPSFHSRGEWGKINNGRIVTEGTSESSKKARPYYS